MARFCDNLRAARKAQNLTIVQCANAIGVTNPAWNQWETGKREPKISALLTICELLRTTPNNLLGVSPPTPDASTSFNAPNNRGTIAAGKNVTVGGDCSKCKLMQEHIREVTGR